MQDLPRSGIEPVSPALAGRLFTIKPPEKPRGGTFQVWSFLPVFFYHHIYLYCGHVDPTSLALCCQQKKKVFLQVKKSAWSWHNEPQVVAGSSLKNTLKAVDAKLYHRARSKAKECSFTGLEEAEKINNFPLKCWSGYRSQDLWGFGPICLIQLSSLRVAYW